MINRGIVLYKRPPPYIPLSSADMLRVFFNASVLFALLNVHPHAGMLLC